MEDTTADLEKEFHFEKRYWRMERAGWIFMGMLVIASMLGFTGPGPLSKKELRRGDGKVVLEYYGILRYETETDFTFHIPLDQEEVSVGIDRYLLTQLFLENIVPQPERLEEREKRPFTSFRSLGRANSSPLSSGLSRRNSALSKER